MVQKRRSTAFRKQQIIDAARRLISKKGSEHLTVRAVAKEVGLTEAAIYRHFKSKRDVLSFLMKHIMASMLEELERSAAEYPHSLDALKIVFQHHLSEIEQRRGMSFQIIAEIISLGDKKLNREVYDKLNIYMNRVGELLSAGLQAGTVRADVDVSAAALLLFGMIQGLANIWALSGYSFDLPIKFESLWNIFQEAISERTRAGITAS
jgi:AcrR family transcriptional regulator